MRKQCGNWRNRKEEKRITVLIEEFQCCSKKIICGEIWLLRDIKDFTSRKLYKGICSICGDDVVLLIEKRIKDDEIYARNIRGIEAVKTIYREKKRRLKVFENIKSDALYGWIYGINQEIKNKKGEVTKIKRFCSDFSGNKKCIETEFVKVK